MGNSLAEARLESNPLAVPAWKSILSLGSAVLLALLFIIAGVWKLTEPFEAATRMIQAKVPGQLAIFTALFMGVPRGRLALAMDALTDALILVGQHGVYCQSARQPGRPAMDIQLVLKSLGDAKELVSDVMQELKRRPSDGQDNRR